MTDSIHTPLDADIKTQIITGDSARRAAKWFNYGNLIALAIPFPLGIFWAGMSMLIYGLNKHHPNPKVGYYTQRAAYRFYGVVGSLIPFGMFFPVHLMYYLIFWAIAAAIILPWSIYDLRLINHDIWENSTVEAPPTFNETE